MLGSSVPLQGSLYAAEAGVVWKPVIPALLLQRNTQMLTAEAVMLHFM